jgi:uncharacterized RDD family membrane protein YckC
MAHANAVPVSGSKLDNRRVLAALIDVLIVGAGYAVILAAAGKLGDAGAGGALTVVGIGWALYYYFACESGSGQTLGKRALNIRVVRTDGAPAGMREVGIRTVLRLVDGLFLYGVGLVVMLVTRERRGRLGDLAGGTMIVSADKPAPRVDMSAPEAPAGALRVPIAESGPAFAEPEDVVAAEPEPEPMPEPVAEVAPEPEVVEPVVELEPEPEVVAEPVAEMELEPVAEVEAEPVVELEPEPVAEVEPPEVEPEPVVDVEPEPVEAVSEGDDPDVASQSLRELASDVTAVTDDPEREVEEEEPEVEEQIAAEAEAEDEPEAEEEVKVKSVETVSAIDLVMEEQTKASKS